MQSGALRHDVKTRTQESAVDESMSFVREVVVFGPPFMWLLEAQREIVWLFPSVLCANELPCGVC
jgi:hypothetical protein